MTSDANRRIVLWVAAPAGRPASDGGLAVLEAAAGLAEPFIDLRWGSREQRRALLRDAVALELPGLTVVADLGDAELRALLAHELPAGASVILSARAFRDRAAAAAVAELKSRGLRVGMEAFTGAGGRAAFDAGAEFLLASGCEPSHAAISRAPRSRSPKDVTSSARPRPDSERYVKVRVSP